MQKPDIYLNLETLEARLSWRKPVWPPGWTTALAAVVLAVLAGFALFPSKGSPDAALGGFFAVLALGFGVVAVLHFRILPPGGRAVVLDRDGFSGYGAVLTFPIKGRWSDFETIAIVHAMLGRSLKPVKLNLLLFGKKRRHRLQLPEIPIAEQQTVFDILYRIAEEHRLELVSDHTDEGARRIRELPWI